MKCIALLLAVLWIGAAAPCLAEEGVVLYLYDTACESCDTDAAFAAQYYALTGQRLSERPYAGFNILHASGQAKLAEIQAQYGLDHVSLPLLVMDGQVYMGDAAIQRDLPRDVVQRLDSTDSVLIYLYVPACESCARAEAILSGLPDTLTIRRGLHTFDSTMRIDKIDMSRETGVALALFEQYQVPDTERHAPIVFATERYFSGAEAIERGLPPAVRAGAALGNGQDPAAMGSALPPLSLAGTVTAGFMGGLNPCAMSMLLLVLSLLAASDRPVGRYAVLFLASKWTAYLLIGTVFLSLFQLFNPTWLPLAAKSVLTAVCLALIALNLADALAARQGHYGRLKNQLPARLRRYLHRSVHAAFAGKWRLGSAIAALGALVAGGEFLCAGQVYLATLLATLRAGIAPAASAGLLLAYCTAFTLPAAIVCLLVVRGKALLAVSGWMLAHMTAIKLATAAMLALIAAYAWLA